MLAERTRITRWIWIGGAVALIWASPILRAALTPASGRTLFEVGLIQSVASLDRSMALAGLGLAVGLMRRTKLVALIALPAAMLGSFWGAPQLLVIFQAWHGLWSAIGLIGPLGLILAGLALLLPRGAKVGVLPLLAALIGLGLGISIEVDRPAADPTLGFAFASMYVSLGIGLAAVLVTAALRESAVSGRGWVIVATRITGSWLTAIGLLLGGLQLLPPNMPDAAIIPLAPPPEFNQSVQP
jgi:hypothetical protein